MRQSGAETLVAEEPYEFIAHVRVCGGAGWVTTGSTRKPTNPVKPHKRVLLRVEYHQRRHYGMKLMAYMFINLRRFCAT